MKYIYSKVCWKILEWNNAWKRNISILKWKRVCFVNEMKFLGILENGSKGNKMDMGI